MGQALILAGVAGLSAVVLGRLIVRPWLMILFNGMGKELPDTWGSFLFILPTALPVLAGIYLIGVGTIRPSRVLAKQSKSTAGAKKRAQIANIIGFVLAALNIVAGIWAMVTGGSFMIVFFLVATTPVLAAVVAKPLTALISRGLSSLLSSTIGWRAPALGLRSVATAGTLSRAGLAGVLVAITLAAFTAANVSLHAGAFYTAKNVHDVPVIVTEDLDLLEPADAEAICSDLSQACYGVIYWQPSDFASTGQESVEPRKANDYTIAATNTEVIDLFVDELFGPSESNSFHADYMKLAATTSENPPVNLD